MYETLLSQSWLENMEDYEWTRAGVYISLGSIVGQLADSWEMPDLERALGVGFPFAASVSAATVRRPCAC